jgi:hypothetical protein
MTYSDDPLQGIQMYAENATPPAQKNTQFENTFACVSGQIPITMNTRYEAIGHIKILSHRTQVADETMDPPAYSASTPTQVRHISDAI